MAKTNVRKEDVTAEELVSLQEVGKGASQKNIPDEHRKRLVELRLVKEGVGGLMQTPHGIFIARSELPSLAGMPREKRRSW
jgi:hypothetical protein